MSGWCNIFRYFSSFDDDWKISSSLGIENTRYETLEPEPFMIHFVHCYLCNFNCHVKVLAGRKIKGQIWQLKTLSMLLVKWNNDTSCHKPCPSACSTGKIGQKSFPSAMKIPWNVIPIGKNIWTLSPSLGKNTKILERNYHPHWIVEL